MKKKKSTRKKKSKKKQFSVRKNKKIMISAILVIIIIIVGGLGTYAYEIQETSQKYMVQEVKPYMKNGVVYFETIDNERSSNIYFKTIGFNVHKEKTKDGNITTSGIRYSSLHMQQYEQSKLTSGFVKSKFQVSEKDVYTSLSKSVVDGMSLEWKQGEVVYFSAIMQVRKGDGKGGFRVLGTFDNLSSLRNSQSWSHPEDFEKYYNIPVTLEFEKQEIHRKIKLNGVSPDNEDSDKVIEEAYPGEHVLVEFPETYTYEGKTYTLQRSSIENRKILGYIYADYSIPPYTMNVVANRNVVQYVGGLNVYGLYVCDEIEVIVQHIDLDTMQPIKEDEVIKVKYGDVVTTKALESDSKE